MTPKIDRRHFLGAAAAIPLATRSGPAARAPRPESKASKKLLVLGGTRFLGPAIVDDALQRGWDVTLFNRGKSNPALYPDLEKRVGDRDSGDLASLAEGEWDIVADTSLYLPEHARQMAELLKDRVGHYVNISTCSVYAPGQGAEVDETSDVGTCTEEDVASVKGIGDVYRVRGGQLYGPLKARCEAILEEHLPGRVTTLRPGVIAGRDDPSDRLPYWAVRVGQGGEILAPETNGRGLQFSDVRDLGECTNDFGDRRVAGIFNSAGFDGKVTFRDLLHGSKAVLGSNCSFTWVDESFLMRSQVRQFVELPFWLMAENATHFANEKGLAAGMRFRPIAETIRETYDWHMEERGADYPWRVYGMNPEREAELLAKWHAREGEEG